MVKSQILCLASISCLGQAQICNDWDKTSGVPRVVPPPKSIQLQPFLGVASKDGQTELEFTEDGTKIVPSVDSLAPLAQYVAEKLFVKSGLHFEVSPAGAASAGDIALVLNEQTFGELDASAEHYTLKVDGDGAAVTCESYRGCAWGVSTMMQSLCVSGVSKQQAALPAMVVEDQPDAPYRGIMLDVARRAVPIEDLFEVAHAAHHYKIPFLHLHMTDDHAWTFPSSTFPDLGSQNVGFRGPAPAVYDVDDLKALVSYADKLGVAVVPELEGPGHSAAMRRSVPSFQGDGGVNPGEGGCINAASEDVYSGMTSLVKEMADVFHTSPFMHVGCDETSTPETLPGYDDFAQKHGIKDGGDLFAYYVKFMADAVNATGKKAMIWGPAALDRLQAKDAIVFSWQGNAGDAQAAIDKGLQAVNAPNSGAGYDQEFGRSLFDFGDPHDAPTSQTVDATDLVIGTQVNMWEVGWDYAQAARVALGGGEYGESSFDEEVARTAGTGWWAKTFPRSAEEFNRSYAMSERTRRVIRPKTCLAPSCGSQMVLV
jgi:N-acetyl-beta-hexosaminidase